jgi:hypothetical protein
MSQGFAMAKKPAEKIEVEAGADHRLARILKRALNTPPTHQVNPKKAKKAAKKATT